MPKPLDGLAAARVHLDVVPAERTPNGASDQRLVVDYDHRRGRLENWDPANPEFRGWSQQKAKMYAEPQRTDFGEFIRKKGFCLD